MSSKLLINEPPLQVLPSLACRVGLNEAIFLQQLHYWLENPKIGKLVDQNKWIRNTIDQWQENFPFWSDKTIKRVIASLREKRLVITRNDLNQLGIDNTNWYTIDYKVLVDLADGPKRAVHGDKLSPWTGQVVPTHGDKLSPPLTIDYPKKTNIYMPPNGGAGKLSVLAPESQPEKSPKTNSQKLEPSAQDELMVFGIYGHQQAPAGSFAEELENSGWLLRSNTVADALEAFLKAGRAAGLALPLPNSDSRRKDWGKSLAGHIDDWGLESLRGGRYQAVFSLAKEGDWLNRISRPGAVDKALGMVENEIVSSTVRNEDGSYNF